MLFLLCLAVFAGAAVFLFLYREKEQTNARIYEQLAEQKQQGSKNDSAAPDDVGDTREPEEKKDGSETAAEEQKPQIPVDFDSLQAQNPDIYAWITIPGTEIDYPIVQSGTDDGYYLNHTIEGREGLPGSIYTESLNSKDFTDKNTVVYGHNMRDGSMFAGLHDYASAEFMAENRSVYIYTRDHIFTYQIFAAVIYGDRHLLRTYNCQEEAGMQSFLDSLRETRNLGSLVDDSVSVTAADRILSMSTCNGQEQQRFLVEAVLVDEQ